MTPNQFRYCSLDVIRETLWYGPNHQLTNEDLIAIICNMAEEIEALQNRAYIISDE